MGLVDWRIMVAVGVLALLVTLVGLRGRKADALPRCKKRRCRYDLSAFIGETKPGKAYPVTCPECGRAAENEREVKWGKRKARRRVVWLGAVVLALCAMVGGVEVYARATNANTLAWMPLWLIMDRAEGDTYENAFPHQSELLRRADAGEITGAAAKRVIARILEWQTDENVSWGIIGDVFALLAMKGYATEEDIRQFWSNVWEFEVVTRPVIEVDETPVVRVIGIWRGHNHELLAFNSRDGSGDLILPEVRGLRYGTFLPRLRIDTVINGEPVRLLGSNHDRWFEIEQLADGTTVFVWPFDVFLNRWVALDGFVGDLAITLSGEIIPAYSPYPPRGIDPAAIPKLSIELSARGLRSFWPIQQTVEVRRVPDGAAAIELVRSDELTQKLLAEGKAIIRVGRRMGTSLDVSFGAFGSQKNTLEFPLACKVVLKMPNGAEHPMDYPFIARALPDWFDEVWFDDLGYNFRNIPPGEQFTVILRPDPEAAAKTTDITRIWDGEIELPVVIDVMVPGARDPLPGEMSKPAPAPAP